MDLTPKKIKKNKCNCARVDGAHMLFLFNMWFSYTLLRNFPKLRYRRTTKYTARCEHTFNYLRNFPKLRIRRTTKYTSLLNYKCANYSTPITSNIHTLL